MTKDPLVILALQLSTPTTTMLYIYTQAF